MPTDTPKKDKNYFEKKKERVDYLSKHQGDADSLIRRLKEEKRRRKEQKRKLKMELKQANI